MRKFSSYGPIDTELNYYVPRQTLVDEAVGHLLGEDPMRGGHYITVWAPRQRGKSWILLQAMLQLRNDSSYANFDVLKINLEHLKMTPDVVRIAQVIAREICEKLALPPVEIQQLDDFYTIFRRNALQKPLILILDEFDALSSEAITGLVSVFRNIYNTRREQVGKTTAEKDYLLHGMALIGVRSVLGLDNPRGSPFNVQRSLHIPNLTFDEVAEMVRWYERESGQGVEPAVIERLYTQLRGQPGLTSWFGELLTETYNEQNPTLTLHDLEIVEAAATKRLPNANIINLISKATEEAHRDFLIELLQTDGKIEFNYDDPSINYLYMNGVIDEEVVSAAESYVMFPSPFVQKRLFNRFARDVFQDTGALYPPFTKLDNILTPAGLHIKNMMRLYEQYLHKNHGWLFTDAPRRSDMRLYEAVYHFNLYMWLAQFLQRTGGRVHPEFPTGNGQIDLLVRYQEQRYGLELKSFRSDFEYHAALVQAARYARQLGLTTITVIFFVEAVDDETRTIYEAPSHDADRGVTVEPLLVTTVE
ncbi:AAA-like domain-containing protein [Chloroflexi bacterium TSY]|nr:AAA-like domain-containing protein [Chloroflexi bacterium TSY]